jgi:uncharacterized protein (DUF2235 family)
MKKRIVFCADGTWDNVNSGTNVYKLFKALPLRADQISFYDDGVGAAGQPIWKLLGGAFGTGLWQKIKDGYTKIAHVYEEGDDLFIFGFSRGAFTARSLAGMIAVCGLPTLDFTDALVDAAFSAYRERDTARRQAMLAELADAKLFNAQIAMVGVWDTVGSLGIPAIFGGIDGLLYGFLDTSLHPDVLHAYHALSIDERRREFPATLWTPPFTASQTVEQVWFAGVHGDVGGGDSGDGSGTTALSDVALGWMMAKAASLGVEFDPSTAAQYKIPLGPKAALDTLHSSWTIAWGFPESRQIANDSTVANSVVIRLQNDASYRPQNLTLVNGALAPQYATAEIVGQQ